MTTTAEGGAIKCGACKETLLDDDDQPRTNALHHCKACRVALHSALACTLVWQNHFYDVLLLVAIVCCFAVDTSICERGFSLMNLLKTAKRSRMGTALLRMLMTIGTLGEEWKDPSKIPAAEIVDIWREESKGGRYLNKFVWGAEGLS
jgi:hypothetical protein